MLQKTAEEWKSLLSPEEFEVLRNRGTEAPNTGDYVQHFPEVGHYVCRACQLPLYSCAAKFPCTCGWAAFSGCYQSSIHGNHVAFEKDIDHGKTRLEILCQNCRGHLGHMFIGWKSGAKNERHCVNSLSVKYVEQLEEEPEGLEEIQLGDAVPSELRSELDDVKYGRDDERNVPLDAKLCVAAVI